jgi:branched-chain amino acid transport system ATP-binding protein
VVVEQNATMALSIADRGYVLATGELVRADTAENLLASEDLERAYLGR